MENTLGDDVIAAAADQRWAIAYHGEEIHFWSPATRSRTPLPRNWFEDPKRESDLRIGMAYLISYLGLVWPWPPEVPDFPPVL